MTDGLTVGGGAPGAPRVQAHLCLQPVPPMGVQQGGGEEGREQRQADGALHNEFFSEGMITRLAVDRDKSLNYMINVQ